MAAAALIQAYTYNLEVQQPSWHGISIRLVTITIVAAGLYLPFRANPTPANSEARRVIAYLHTFAATILLAFLAWHEASSGWLAPVW